MNKKSDRTTTAISNAGEVIKLKIMSKNKLHNYLEMKCKETRTAHSPTVISNKRKYE